MKFDIYAKKISAIGEWKKVLGAKVPRPFVEDFDMLEHSRAYLSAANGVTYWVAEYDGTIGRSNRQAHEVHILNGSGRLIFQSTADYIYKSVREKAVDLYLAKRAVRGNKPVIRPIK